MPFRQGLQPWKLEPGYDAGSGAGVFKDILKDLKNIAAELARHGLDLTALETAATAGTPATPVVAAESMFTGACVTVDGYRGDSSTLSHAGKVIGVALNVAAPGGLVLVQQQGLVPVTGFAVGQRLFVGSSGLMTAAPPIAGFQQSMGVALGPSAVVVSLSEPLILAGA